MILMLYVKKKQKKTDATMEKLAWFIEGFV